MIRILNAEANNYSAEATAILHEVGDVTLQENLSRADLLACIPQFDVLIVRLGFQIDRALIDTAKRLKVIVSATTGVDHIDMAYANEKNIAVLTLRGEVEFLKSIPATVEHTLGLMLALIRQTPWAFESVKSGRWDRDAFKGHDLFQQTLGIVGLGRIGERVAHLARALGMSINVYDPYRDAFPDFVDRADTLNELLPEVDILTIHAPLNQETIHLISFDELARMKSQSYVINTARGDIINDVALLQNLMEGHIAGAALDVIPDERFLSKRGSPLIEYACEHNNLLITPHIGGATYESMAMTEIFMARKLQRHLSK
jgi:D-3-phosphoglycerate dehydrogenase / 2-oxoglutarate reductase